MFKRLQDDVRKPLTVTINGQTVQVNDGDSVAAAVLVHGLRFTRTTAVSGAPRAPFCLMGVCFECLMVIDGKPNQRACMETVREGMRIETQQGAGKLPS